MDLKSSPTQIILLFLFFWCVFRGKGHGSGDGRPVCFTTVIHLFSCITCPLWFFVISSACWFFEVGSCFVTQVPLNSKSSCLSLKYWDYRTVPPLLDLCLSYKTYWYVHSLFRLSLWILFWLTFSLGNRNELVVHRTEDFF